MKASTVSASTVSPSSYFLRLNRALSNMTFRFFTKCWSKRPFTSLYFFWSAVERLKRSQDIVRVVPHCVQERVDLHLLSLTPQSGSDTETFKSSRPLGPLVRTAKREGLWRLYLVRPGHSYGCTWLVTGNCTVNVSP